MKWGTWEKYLGQGWLKDLADPKNYFYVKISYNQTVQTLDLSLWNVQEIFFLSIAKIKHRVN